MKEFFGGIRLTGFFLVMVLLIVAACDPFREDSSVNTKDLNATKIYTIPGSSVVIDLRTVVNHSLSLSTLDSLLTLEIALHPKGGYITALDTFHIIYHPYAFFTEGQDQFQLSAVSRGKTVGSGMVYINMVEKLEKIPCSLFAVEDSVLLNSDSTFSIHILNNDLICGVQRSDIDISIYSGPHYGQADLTGDVITYKRESEFNGSDFIVYKITSTTNTKMYAMGLIAVRNLKCEIGDLPPYTYLDLSHSENNAKVYTEGCGMGYVFYDFSGEEISALDFRKYLEIPCRDLASVKLTQTSNSGQFCYDGQGHLSYIPEQSAVIKNDTARLEICINGQCRQSQLIVKRTNQGKWRLLSAGGSAIFFTDENTGFVGGDVIMKTTDGGLTWKETSCDFGNDYGDAARRVSAIENIFFIDSTHGFATAGEVILRTDNGGENWRAVSVLQSEFEFVYPEIISMHFTSPSVGFVGTQYGNIFKTTNGGLSWKPVYVNPEPSLIYPSDRRRSIRNLQFIDQNTGVAHTDTDLVSTSDGGESWIRTSLSPQLVTAPADVIMDLITNDQNLFMISFKRLWRASGDLYVTPVLSNNYLTYYNSISFSPSGQLGMAVGSRYRSGVEYKSYEALISKDGGLSWVSSDLDDVYYKGSAVELREVSIPSDKVAYALTSDGYILKYDDR